VDPVVSAVVCVLMVTFKSAATCLRLQAEYRQWAPGDRPQKVKREEYVPSDAPFEGKPSYQMDYQAHRAAPMTRSFKPKEQEYTKGGPT